MDRPECGSGVCGLASHRAADAAGSKGNGLMTEGYGATLRPWDIIRIRIAPAEEWITDVVYRVRPDLAEIDVGLEPLRIDLKNLIGSHVDIRYVSDQKEILFHGTAKTLQRAFPQSLTVGLEAEERLEYRRDARRFEVNLSAILKTSVEEENGTFAHVGNISATGMSFTTHMDLSLLLGLPAGGDANIYSEVFVRPDKILSMEGTIVRSLARDAACEYGMRFSPAGNKRLLMYLFTLEDEMAALQKYHKELHVGRTS